VLAIALGQPEPAAAERAVYEALGDHRLTDGPPALNWLDRGALRRRPVQALLGLWRQRYAVAVLVAPDLDQPRLRLTSLVVALPRAACRLRTDLRGRHAPFRLGAHLREDGPLIIRHLLACGLALVLTEPAVRLLARVLRPRPARPICRPRRVLYLRSQLWLGLAGGGSVAHTAGVIGGLQQHGLSVRVVSSDALPGVQAPIWVRRPETWFDGLGRELEELAYNVAFVRAALGLARRWRPDMIYQRHTAFGLSGALLSRLLGVPLVLEFNSSEVWKGRYWGGLRLVHLAERIERLNLAAADWVVVVSGPLRASLIAMGLPAAKIIVNPNGVDPCQFRPDLDGRAVRARWRLGSPAESVVLGFSGTFGLWHGIPSLAAAIPQVLAARPAVRFLLVGDGPLRHLVDGLGEQVRCPGLVPHAEMPAYLAACDVLLSPHGRQADGGEFFGSPTKLFEYMAAGRPIVASAVGQIAEVLEDGQTALLVPPDDVPALVEAVVHLVDDAALRARLGAAARAQAVARHTWRQNADRLLASLDQPA